MAKDLSNLRIRLKKIADEELEYKKSRKIVFLEEPPVLKNFVWDFHQKKDSPKVKKIIQHIEDNYLCSIFKDNMDLYKEAASSKLKKNKKLEKLSKKYKINLGDLLGVKGDFCETEDQDLDFMIKRLANLRV